MKVVNRSLTEPRKQVSRRCLDGTVMHGREVT